MAISYMQIFLQVLVTEIVRYFVRVFILTIGDQFDMSFSLSSGISCLK